MKRSRLGLDRQLTGNLSFAISTAFKTLVIQSSAVSLSLISKLNLLTLRVRPNSVSSGLAVSSAGEELDGVIYNPDAGESVEVNDMDGD